MKHKHNRVVTDYWLAHYIEGLFCSLCGNSGIIHTEGVKTASGVVCGRANFCICPNGQEWRASTGDDIELALKIIRQ